MPVDPMYNDYKNLASYLNSNLRVQYKHLIRIISVK